METIRVKVEMTVAVPASVVLHCTIMKRKGTSWATGWMDSVSRTGQAESTPLYLNTITEKNTNTTVAAGPLLKRKSIFNS